jgi:hypothetical protein
MCLSFSHCCGHDKFSKSFEREIEKTDDGLTIKIKAKNPEKAIALKKMYEAHRELCGEECD